MSHCLINAIFDLKGYENGLSLSLHPPVALEVPLVRVLTQPSQMQLKILQQSYGDLLFTPLVAQ
jgi:hypothetical protein